MLDTLRTLASSLGRLLAERGEGARRLEAVFFRADGKMRRLTIETG
jgi:protein ImuB